MSQETALDLVCFKIDASQCDLRIGDRVTPKTKIGRDWKSKAIIQAGCHGRVESITFSGSEHVLTIAIRPAVAAKQPKH